MPDVKVVILRLILPVRDTALREDWGKQRIPDYLPSFQCQKIIDVLFE